VVLPAESFDLNFLARNTTLGPDFSQSIFSTVSSGRASAVGEYLAAIDIDFRIIPASSCYAASANLIQNCSFEEPLHNDGTFLPGVINSIDGSPKSVTTKPTAADGFYVLKDGALAIKGWEVFSTSAGETVDWVHDGNLAASDGTLVIDLNGTPGPGGIRQTIETVTGLEYKVQFDLAGNAAGNLLGPPETLVDPIKMLRVSAAGQSEDFSFDVSNQTITDMGYENVTWSFVAQDTSTTLEFLSLNPVWPGADLDNEFADFGPVIDNISVVANIGDYDFDGDVDGRDFLEWQREDGTAAGLASWEANFGNGVPSVVGTSQTVPEPTTLWLALLPAVACCLNRRHYRAQRSRGKVESEADFAA